MPIDAAVVGVGVDGVPVSGAAVPRESAAPGLKGFGIFGDDPHIPQIPSRPQISSIRSR